MSNFSSDNVIIILSVILLMALIFSGHDLYFRHRLSERRVTRIARPLTKDPQTLHNLPSIARARYSALKRSRAGNKSPAVAAILWLDQLLYSSGLKWRLSSLFIVLLFSVLFFTVILTAIMDIGLVGGFIIGLCSATFGCIQLLIRRRSSQLGKFRELFPEALDLIVRSVRAGLPVSEAIKLIGSEIADPVGEAFREVAANLNIGMSLDDSLRTLQKKMPIAEVKFFAISLTIQQETGGNLAEILSNLASIMRRRVQIGKKVRALSSEARASALIIGALPFLVGLVIFFLNREYMEILFFDEIGQMFLLGAFFSLSLGAFVMARMTRFEI